MSKLLRSGWSFQNASEANPSPGGGCQRLLISGLSHEVQLLIHPESLVDPCPCNSHKITAWV